jgi:hypothetical protein
LFDAQGKLVFHDSGIREERYRLQSSGLKNGIYRFVLQGPESWSGTILLQK